ncbi:MAG: ATP-binding protein [Betaproteobacteria bacterium]
MALSTPSSIRALDRNERQNFLALWVLFAALNLAVIPWGAQRGPEIPEVIGVTGTIAFVAGLLTAYFLGNEYRHTGRTGLLYLTCAYLYGAVMAMLHALSYPGALLPQGIGGTHQTFGWAFLAWRAGFALIVLAAVLFVGKYDGRSPRLRQRLTWGCVTTLAACVLVYTLCANASLVEIDGDRFITLALAVCWVIVALGALSLVLIWRTPATADVLYFWLGLVVVGYMADLAMSSASGLRYTLGWYVSKANIALSSCILLVFWLAQRPTADQPLWTRTVATYLAALCVLAAGLSLHWALSPWMGMRVPYATTFGAIGVTVLMAGWGPATVVAVVGFTVANYYFVEPVAAFEVIDPGDVLSGVVFFFSATVIVMLGETMRRARDRARQAEIELQARAEELQQADVNKSRFLAILSHELRNPLAPLRTGLALLTLARDEKTAGETHAMMERQVGYLARLIDDLLDVSRIEQGKLELKRTKIALDSAVRNAIETARPNIEAKSQQLIVRQAQELLCVEGDPTRLSQVIANLLHNASKFTPSGGRIEIETRSEGDVSVISVKDDGIGIPPEDLKSVFEMFVQVQSTRSEAAGGLGLGLNLVRTLVELHGGAVEARSAGMGKGSEFSVRLPLAEADADLMMTATPARRAQRGEKRRILVVDDNQDAANTLSDLLRIDGHETQPAYDGGTALRIAHEFRPDVAFIDLNMPGMDGFELARRIRAEPWGKSLTLIALTGMGQQSEIEQTRQTGFDYHLTKPALPDQVLRIAAGI